MLQTLPHAGRGNNDYFVMVRACYRRMFVCVVMILLGVSCKHESNIIHVGENHSGHCLVEVDTTFVCLENSSGEGNFYLKDSIITFVDVRNCTFYDMNLDGQLIESYFGKGRGENEIGLVMYAYPIENDPLNRGVIVDQNGLVTIFDRKNRKIDYSKKMNFGKVNGRHDQYKSPGLYNIIDFTDLGVSFYLDSDSLLIFPAGINDHVAASPDRIDDERYEKGAILGKLNLSTMEVDRVLGRFPEIYKHKPMPHLEFFQYVISNGLLYVDHAVDSLIYVYKYPDDLQYTMGYECSRFDRDYTSTRTIDQGENFYRDMQHVGVNSGLLFCPENNTLCRTYLKNMMTCESGMQIYKNNDLIADVEMPAYFKLLGYRDGFYYGVRLTPVEDPEFTYLVLYKIKIDWS